MTLQDWLTQIEAEPDDWDTYQAFSDWLKDNGMATVGHAVWWMWRRKKRPECSALSGRPGYWRWFRKGRDSPLRSSLPPCIFTGDHGRSGNLWEMITWLAAQLEDLRREHNAE